MSEELKPCPFCGGTSDEDDYNDMSDPENTYEDPPVCFMGADGMVVAGCFSCEVRVYGDTKQAAESWNTRPIEDALKQRIRELEEANNKLREELNKWKLAKNATVVETGFLDQLQAENKNLKIKLYEEYYCPELGVQRGIFEQITPIKPGHGSCCTCQTCGRFHDDCVCGHNEFIDEVIEMLGSDLIQSLKQSDKEDE